MPLTALIILNYNNADATRSCLASVAEHNTAPVKIVVVDNGSHAHDLATLRAHLSDLYGAEGAVELDPAEPSLPAGHLSDVALIPLPENRGYARGNNAGLQAAYADPDITHVMILNNDILFVDDIIGPLIAARSALADCAIISPILYKRDMQGIDYNCARLQVSVSRLIVDNLFHHLRRLMGRDRAGSRRFILRGYEKRRQAFPDVLPIELPSGSCMLIDKDTFRRLGSFDESTFLYYEENILYSRTSAAGLRNYLCTSLRCIHLGAATMKRIERRRSVLEASMRSERYWVTTYSGASAPLKALHAFSQSVLRLALRLGAAMKKGKPCR